MSKLAFEDSTFIKISIDGYEIAYWICDGKMVNTTEINCLIGGLSKAINKEIVSAHLGYIHEGD